MRRLVLGLVLIAGCGGDSDEKRGAQDASLRGQVEAQISRQTEAQLGVGPSAQTDLNVSPATANCKAVSDSKLTCVVEGSVGLGRDYRWEWEATVDPDSGRFAAKPTKMDSP